MVRKYAGLITMRLTSWKPLSPPETPSGNSASDIAAAIQRQMIDERGAAHARNPLDGLEQTLLVWNQSRRVRVIGSCWCLC